MLIVDMLPVLQDNYIFMLVDEETRVCAVVDPAEAPPVLTYLQQHNLTLEAIYNTHHHGDHVGGNLELKAQTGCKIFGYGPDAERLPGLDHPLAAGDLIHVGHSQGRVLFAPGHTRGHVLYHFDKERICFVGDTLFSLGCGRLFEGTAGQMWQSLQHFKAMPQDTKIYCAHEYTLANCRFAETLVGEEVSLMAYKEKCLALQEKGVPTIPTTLAVESSLNPFLAVASLRYRELIGRRSSDPLEAFTELRRQKDHF